jgi:hypothetical protein
MMMDEFEEQTLRELEKQANSQRLQTKTKTKTKHENADFVILSASFPRIILFL